MRIKWGMTLAAGLSLLLAAAGPSRAAIVLDFEGLQDFEGVEEFYNGGTGSLGSGPGADLGVSFSSNALALIDSDAGGTGNFGGEPSPDTILFFSSGASTTLNVAAGFDTGFSFFYSAPLSSSTIRIFDGLDATGNVLATFNLPTTPFGGAPDPTGLFSPFVPIGVSFAGTAQSVDFAGSASITGFDDITLGSAVPGGVIPEPGSMALLGLGLAGIAARRRKAA